MAEGNISARYCTNREILASGTTGEAQANLENYEKNANFLIISAGSGGMCDTFVIDNSMNYNGNTWNIYRGARNIKFKLNADHSIIYFDFGTDSVYVYCRAVKI